MGRTTKEPKEKKIVIRIPNKWIDEINDKAIREYEGNISELIRELIRQYVIHNN